MSETLSQVPAAQVPDGAFLLDVREPGEWLAGHAPDRAEIREALTAQGANPLVVRAFRDRGAERTH